MKRSEPNLKSRILDLAMIILSPLTIVWLFLYLPFVGLYHYFLQERRFRAALGKRGKLPRDEKSLSGTIIVDQAAFNHCRQRIWWTPDDVLTLCPIPMPTESDEAANDERFDRGDYIWPSFDRWVYERYLDEATGTAFLIETSLRWRDVEGLKRRFRSATVIATYSGGKVVEEMMTSDRQIREKNGKSGNKGASQ